MFTAALTEAGPRLPQLDLDGIERELQTLSRQVLGRVVAAAVATRAAQDTAEPPACPRCEQPLRLVGRQRPRQLQGLVGGSTLRRPYVVCDQCHQGQAPLDAALGLGRGSLSPALTGVVCRLGVETSFGAAAVLVEETLAVRVPAEAVRRLTEGVGAVAEAENQVVIKQAQAGQVPPTGVLPAGAALLVEADGAMMHLDDAWHEVKVGLVAPLGPQTRTDAATQRERRVLGHRRTASGWSQRTPSGTGST